MAQAAEFCWCQAKITFRGYHVYKNTTWVDAREGDEVQVDIKTNKESMKVDPYACAIRVKDRFFGAMKTVVHIPREISWHVYFFIKAEGVWVNGKVLSVKYRPSPIAFLKIKKFISELYDSEYTGEGKSEESEEEVRVSAIVS